MSPRGFPWILFNYKSSIFSYTVTSILGVIIIILLIRKPLHALKSTVLQYLWHGILVKNQGTEQFWCWNIQPDTRPELYSIPFSGMTKSNVKTKLNWRARAGEVKVWSLSSSFLGKTKAKPNTGKMRIYSID